MTPELFGTMPDGTPVERVQISDGNLTAWIITYGASVQDLRLTGHGPSLVLGFSRFSDHLAHGRYFGANVGRFANRIGKARCEIDGRTYHLDRNFREEHTLHGGTAGTGARVWRLVETGADFAVLQITESDGHMGFPGTVTHTCRYTVENSGLRVDFESVTDAPTVVSLAHHSYFNLDGSADCLDHVFQIHAESYLPVDADLIPTPDAPASVDATLMDLREPARLRDRVEAGGFFDHNYCLAQKRRPLLNAATVAAPASGIRLDVETSEPGLQFYAGHNLNIPVHGHNGHPYKACAGFALEAQIWPDAPNRADFPSALLRPGETSRQTTRYTFRKI